MYLLVSILFNFTPAKINLDLHDFRIYMIVIPLAQISLYNILHFLRRLRYPGSAAYWEKRYASGGHSGTGSAGVLAGYKAGFVNRFVRDHTVNSVVELGCGDGRQLLLAQYPAYTGLDIAPAAIERCKSMFAGDPAKRFEGYDPLQYNPDAWKAELALSMEVVFHLTEDDLYEQYLRHLFASATRYVVIFSSDEPDLAPGRFPHFRSRRFSPDIPRLAPGWTCTATIRNPHRAISISDFHIFERS
jgi:SAM-dependent methyltransferase